MPNGMRRNSGDLGRSVSWANGSCCSDSVLPGPDYLASTYSIHKGASPTSCVVVGVSAPEASTA